MSVASGELQSLVERGLPELGVHHMLDWAANVRNEEELVAQIAEAVLASASTDSSAQGYSVADGCQMTCQNHNVYL